MLRLIFTICMIEAPDTCEQREMLVYDQISARACVMGAMPELATWRQTHPNWRIARWRCEDDRTAERIRSLAKRTPPAADSAATAPGAVPITNSH